MVSYITLHDQDQRVKNWISKSTTTVRPLGGRLSLANSTVSWPTMAEVLVCL